VTAKFSKKFYKAVAPNPGLTYEGLQILDKISCLKVGLVEDSVRTSALPNEINLCAAHESFMMNHMRLQVDSLYEH